MADSYCYLRLRADEGDADTLAGRLRTRVLPSWRESGVTCWGMWQGLFGLDSRELLVMAAATGERSLGGLVDTLAGAATALHVLPLVSTVRPQSIEPPRRDGLYVLRFFEVRPADCDVFVALSEEAWQTFERSDRYASRPTGLFRPRALTAPHSMLLVTWYDGLASWESSRAPAPRARELFQQRRGLTLGTVAYAARLIPG